MASCPKPRQQYPFEQSLVKGTDLCMDFVNKEGVDVIKGVAREKGEWAALSPEGVDNAIAIEQGLVSETWQLLPGEVDTQVCGTMAMEYSDSQSGVDCSPEMALCLDEGGMNEETPVGPPNTQQIKDVQGRIKTNIVFWREVLKAPGYVLTGLSQGTSYHYATCQIHFTGKTTAQC